MDKVIKLKIFQEKAVFRTPWSMEIVETYPLPPYSTILGFIHNMLSSNKTIEEIKISVQGKYGNLTREFVRYHKYIKNKNEGKPYPIIITFLTDLELIIHIKMPTPEFHAKLLMALENPPYFPYLGRPEDLIINIEVHEDEEGELDPSATEEGSIKLPYNCYVQFDIAKDLRIEGVPYLIPSYYKLVSRIKGKKKKCKETFRNFEIVKVLYVQAEQIVTKKIKVDGEGVPIWWMK